MRQWASGVTVITVRAKEDVHGMTASSFASVSCDPPLVLFCIGQANDTHAMLAAGSRIAAQLIDLSRCGIDSVSLMFSDYLEGLNRFETGVMPILREKLDIGLSAS